MGVRGGNSPDGLKQRRLRTIFLRAPFQDWAALTQGFKTEFRSLPRGVPSQWIHAPTPVVLYAVSPQLKRREELLMVLAEHRSERLMDIAEDPQALMREGFADYREFRRYWRARSHRPYRPMDRVEVFRLAPWPSGTQSLAIDQLGRALLHRLYGDYMPGAASRTASPSTASFYWSASTGST